VRRVAAAPAPAPPVVTVADEEAEAFALAQVAAEVEEAAALANTALADTAAVDGAPDGYVPAGMRVVHTSHVLNEVVIDRGPAAYISNLDVYCNGAPITCVQGDGLLVATPTGSTAYSVSAGGSIVHPSVPAILLTPICPHSLSFRPIVVPSTVELKVQVPLDARNSAWVSMDGRNRLRLNQGDFVRITVSHYPVRGVYYCSICFDAKQNKPPAGAHGKQLDAKRRLVP
jgi:NAD+ kinase